MRVMQFLSEQHIAYEPLIYPPAYTAQKRAKHLHMPGRQVAKTVLLVGPDGYLLAILPATQHVDTALRAGKLRGPFRLATDEEIGEAFPDCEWGVVAPFGTVTNSSDSELTWPVSKSSGRSEVATPLKVTVGVPFASRFVDLMSQRSQRRSGRVTTHAPRCRAST